MYERFSDRARKVMQLANQEAQRFNHEYVGPEHILLGLVKEGTGVAANVLKNLDIDLRRIRLEVEKLVQVGPDMMTMGKLPQTPAARKIIAFAIEEAKNLNHNYVGTEHLLLGMLREGESVAATVLATVGVKLEAARERIRESLKGDKLPEGATLNYNKFEFRVLMATEIKGSTALPSVQYRKAGCPDEILSLANTNSIVRSCMDCWKSGHVTWDEALAIAVVQLAEQNAALTAGAAKVASDVKPDTTVEGNNA